MMPVHRPLVENIRNSSAGISPPTQISTRMMHTKARASGRLNLAHHNESALADEAVVGNRKEKAESPFRGG
jgi:hypothetical protein